MRMVTDFHSHVLPGIDDGSKHTEDSIKMLQMLSEQGISRVIATPHFYPENDSPEAFLARRAASEQRLREEMEKHTGLPELIIGAEVYYYSGISDWDMLPDLTIGNNKCILIEMPLQQWTGPMYQELVDIYERYGIWPVVAHLDRYIRPMKTFGIPERLDDMPVYVQANAASFLKFPMRRTMMRLLQRGQIHLLGSDCHDLTDRKPDMQEAVEMIRRHLGDDAIAHIQYCERSLLRCTQ